jgi:membrane protein implicated in regulation of membrane protease activity
MTFWIVLALVVLHVVEGWWAIALLLGTGLFELSQTAFWLRYTNRRTAVVGAEALVGRVVEVSDECRPFGRVRVQGELWNARCPEGAGRGDHVRITGLDGLTLEVVREPH